LKNLFFGLTIVVFFASCANDKKPVVSNNFIDSLINNYSPSPLSQNNEKEMQFWKGRISPALPDFLNNIRYAGCLALKFRFFGDMADLKSADSILEKVDRDFNGKEASVYMGLAAHCMTEHRFMVADSFLQKAKKIGVKPYDAHLTSFDIDFELGKYAEAKAELNAIASPSDYGYLYRKSKIEHVEANLDSSISTMTRAAELAENKYLKEVALGNVADLYIHAGDLQKANDLYMECVRMNSADFHCILGLGWIALMHDNNDSLAKKIFEFVQSKNKLPDALLKLAQMADAMRDTSLLLQYAKAFEQKSTDSVYGRMYNKYLLDLYTGILQNPARAEAMTKDELNNRTTPQTYAWYAYALFMNNKKEEAYKVFENHVSGKPLEGPELYQMGILMDGLDKKYNAIEFFKAAYKNKYDLNPSAVRFIEKRLAN
jgi:tetratricopeptide (TPR) repeat protein